MSDEEKNTALAAIEAAQHPNPHAIAELVTSLEESLHEQISETVDYMVPSIYVSGSYRKSPREPQGYEHWQIQISFKYGDDHDQDATIISTAAILADATVDIHHKIAEFARQHQTPAT